MEHKAIIELINRLEQNYPVSKWVSNEIYLWPYIRITIALKLYDQMKQKPSEVAGTSLAPDHTVINRIKGKFEDYKLKKRLNAKATHVFYSFPSCRTMLKGKWFNKYFDAEVERLKKNGISSLVLEFPEKNGYKEPIYNSRSCVKAEQNLVRYTWSTKHEKVPFKIDFESYNKFLDELTKQLPHINFDFISVKEIERKFRLFKLMIQYFKEILIMNKTKVVYVSCYYDFKAMALVAAANQLKITTVDVQHGLQGSYHAAYGNWSNVPKEGYNLLPKFFWCWNQNDADTINLWAKANGKHFAFNGRNPWLDIWINEGTSLVIDLKSEISPILNKLPNGRNLLYTAQPIADPVPEFIMEAILSSPNNWNWWIRLHPRQDMSDVSILKEKLGAHLNRNVFIELPSKLPLPLLLTHCCVNITKWSSVVLEANDMNKPSIVIHQNGYDIYTDYVKRKKAFFYQYSSSVKNFNSYVESIIGMYDYSSNSSASNQQNYFELISIGEIK